jgi:hypothetical protein
MYHVGWPGVDPMNADNPMDAQDRSNYYNVNGVPNSVVNGIVYNGHPAEITQQNINDWYEAESQLDIQASFEIIHDTITQKDSISIKCLVKSLKNLLSGHVLNLVLTENVIQYDNPPGTNGEKIFNHVMKKMLPSSGGKSLPVMAAGDSLIYNYKYPLILNNGKKLFYDLTQARLVAFVQNKTSKKILGSTIYQKPTVPAISYIEPRSGGNGGSIGFSIFGGGFEPGTKVRFTKTGSPAIEVPDSLLALGDVGMLNGTLDLHQPVDTGLYDIEIEIPDDTTLRLRKGFRVVYKIEPRIVTQLIGSDRIRQGAWRNFFISVTNEGNVDATGIPVYLAIDSNIPVKFSNSFFDYDLQGNLRIRDSLCGTVAPDSLYGKPFHGKLYPLLLVKLPGQSTDLITFKVRASDSIPFEIMVWNDEPLFGSPLKLIWGNCVDAVVDLGLNFIPGAGCAWSVFSNLSDPVIKLMETKKIGEYQSNVGLTGSGGIVSDYLFGFSNTVLSCVPGSAVIKTGAGLMKNMLNVMKSPFLTKEGLVGIAGSSNGVLSECDELINKNKPKEKKVRPVNSLDPNDIIGPDGFGPQKYIPITSEIPYLIRFENVRTATAPAQIVEIRDTLDLSMFDPETFSFGGITFGEKTISVPYSKNAISIDHKLNNDLILHIEASFNKSSGIINWLFSTLDSKNLFPTEDPDAGFLPPNVNAPEGEGSVFFTVSLRRTLPHDTRIRNSATIYFDQNPPIATNLWQNKIDKISPVSRVSSESSAQLGNQIIKLKFSGTDLGSGVESHSIYYSENGGKFQLLKEAIGSDSVSVSGEFGKTYSFFSVSSDSTGNKEEKKEVAEATVSLISVPEQSELNVFVAPNPNNGHFNFIINNEKEGEFEIQISDPMGKVISKEKRVLIPGPHLIEKNINRTGLFFLTISKGAKKVTKTVCTIK